MTDPNRSLWPVDRVRSRDAGCAAMAFTLAALLIGACGDAHAGRDCTLEYRYFRVDVKAPENLVVDSVTVENSSLQECEHNDGLTAPKPGGGRYACGEQGGGEYVIRVHAGERTWTQTVDIESDGCHIQNAEDVLFDLTDEGLDCTAEQRTFAVAVTSPDGLPVDRVTVENSAEVECEASSTAGSYDCGEQEAGEYVVRVYSGDLTWTQTFEPAHDGCHITPPSEALTFELTEASPDPRECSAELRSIRVELSSPEGLVVDAVTVENTSEQPCEAWGEDGLAYQCHEQRGGEYIVRVHSGELTWTKTLELAFDGCHIDEGESLSFELTRESADD